MQLWDGCPWAAAGCAPCRGAFGSARLTRRNRVLQSLCRAFLCASLCAFLCSDLVRADEPDHLHTENLKNPALASRREDRLQERQRLPRPSLRLSRCVLPLQTSRTPLLHRSQPLSCETAPRMRAVATQEIRSCLATGFSRAARLVVPKCVRRVKSLRLQAVNWPCVRRTPGPRTGCRCQWQKHPWPDRSDCP